MVAILIVVLLLFGGTKIPQLMRGLGKGMGEFQKGIEEGKKNFDSALREEPAEDTVTESKSAPHAS
ncbi:MAG: Sec-independent protein translocase protein TatA [Fimbriimonadaceae bacterium]|nr:Sec-independent protein translocase protein TatA [Fimbriimonadaceae bacterium]